MKHASLPSLSGRGPVAPAFAGKPLPVNAGLIVKFLPLAAWMILLSEVANGQAPTYVVFDLGTFGGNLSEAQGINNSGQVVGMADAVSWVDIGSRAFMYSSGSMQNLGLPPYWSPFASSYAEGINNSGQVVGYVSPNDQAFLCAGGSMKAIGTLGGEYSYANAINNAGQVVGRAYTVSGVPHAFLYSNGSMQDLGTLGGTTSGANAINDNGQVVGASAITADSTSHAFLYSNGSMQDLGTLGGTYSGGAAINNAGQVVGDSYMSDGSQHAFLYSNGSMQDIGTLAEPYYSISAKGINNRGQVVGCGYYTMGIVTHNHAFLYSNGSIWDLNSLPLIGGSGWTLEVGSAINDAGQIAGYGISPSGDREEGY